MDKQKKSDGFLAASHCIALKEKGATGERQPLHKGASGMSDQHSSEKAGSPPPPGCYLPLDS